MKQQQIDAFCTPAWHHWDCVWDANCSWGDGAWSPVSKGWGLLLARCSVQGPDLPPAQHQCGSATGQTGRHPPNQPKPSAVLRDVLCYTEKGWVKIGLEGCPCPLGCSGVWWLKDEKEQCPWFAWVSGPLWLLKQVKYQGQRLLPTASVLGLTRVKQGQAVGALL